MKTSISVICYKHKVFLPYGDGSAWSARMTRTEEYYHRPRMSIGYKIPAVACLERGEQKRMWPKKKMPRKVSKMEIMAYHRESGQQGRAKAYAGVPDH